MERGDEGGGGRHTGRAVLIGAAVIVVGVLAARVVLADRPISRSLGDAAETRDGVITVHGWDQESGVVTVHVTACPGPGGRIVDVTAFRLVADDRELAPSDDGLGGATVGPACVDGEVTFSTDADPDRVVYRSSPMAVWRRG